MNSERNHQILQASHNQELGLVLPEVKNDFRASLDLHACHLRPNRSLPSPSISQRELGGEADEF